LQLIDYIPDVRCDFESMKSPTSPSDLSLLAGRGEGGLEFLEESVIS
jgi:hypothetical protein